MRKVITTAAAGLILGGILALAQSYYLLPWVLVFMMACLAANLRTAAPWIDNH